MSDNAHQIADALARWAGKAQVIRQAVTEVLTEGGRAVGVKTAQEMCIRDRFNDVRSLIMSGRIADAEQILNGVPPERRNAEWYFLKGRCV